MSKFVNLLNVPVRVQRNPELRDSSYMAFKSQGAEYGCSFELEASVTETNSGSYAAVDNVYVLQMGRGTISLPNPEPDTYYIVPQSIAFMCGDRTDLVYPVDRQDDGTRQDGAVFKSFASYNA